MQPSNILTQTKRALISIIAIALALAYLNDNFGPGIYTGLVMASLGGLALIWSHESRSSGVIELERLQVDIRHRPRTYWTFLIARVISGITLIIIGGILVFQ